MSRVEEIRARMDAAIPGPWRWFGNAASHQVFLGTAHSGRLFLLQPGTVVEEYVYHHEHGESYTLGEAVEAVDGWFPDEEERRSAREFLSSQRHYSDHNDWHWSRVVGNTVVLSRGLQVYTDLRFQGRKDDGSPDVLMVSYRDIARYEVLNGLTKEENAALERPHELYREDIVGLDNAEADFIAHAREDIPWLLGRTERLLARAAAALERAQVGDAEEAAAILEGVVTLAGDYVEGGQDAVDR